jgi:RNA-splicing ligase RtcB
MFELKGKYTSAKVMIDDVDQSCISQIYTFLNHPAFINPIAIMPDCHVGKGAVIGFTMPITDKIIPATIGVDIGCGMLSIDLGETLNISLDVLDKKIRERIPFGFNTHDSSVIHLKNEFPWKDVREQAKTFIYEYNSKFGTSYLPERYDGEENWFQNKCTQIGANQRRTINSIGSLGGGNHFIDLGKSDDARFWLTIHTGSRNFGKCVCEYWQNHAINIVHKQKSEDLSKEINRIRSTYVGKDIEKEINALRGTYGLDNVSKQLCYLEGESAIKYFFDMIFSRFLIERSKEVLLVSIVTSPRVLSITCLATSHFLLSPGTSM